MPWWILLYCWRKETLLVFYGWQSLTRDVRVDARAQVHGLATAGTAHHATAILDFSPVPPGLWSQSQLVLELGCSPGAGPSGTCLSYLPPSAFTHNLLRITPASV